MNRGGFSWKRLLGISRMKATISRKMGVPLTKSGREQKIGRVITQGCMRTISVFVFIPLIIFFLIN